MPVDPRVKLLTPEYDRFADTREVLDHARQQATKLGLDDYFIVDVDSHREPNAHWLEVLEYVENPVMRRNSEHDYNTYGFLDYVPFGFPGGTGFVFQSVQGRIPHNEP